MKNKNSIIFLKDWAILIQSMPADKQLIFWDLFMNYDHDLECNDLVIKPIWNFIKVQLQNMDKKYNESVVERNRKNGAKGGRKPTQETQTNPKNPVGYFVTQKTLNENENENENVNENDDEKVLRKNPSPSSENAFLSISECREHFDTFQIFQKDSLGMTYKIPPAKMYLIQNEFDNFLINSGTSSKIAKDYARHFGNWLAKKDDSWIRAITAVRLELTAEQKQQADIRRKYQID